MPDPSHAWLVATLELDHWMRQRDYAGYDPHDFLTSPAIRLLSFRSRWLSAAWTQVGRRSPLQLRPLLDVEPRRNAKAIGLILASHARIAGLGGQEGFALSAAELLEWLGRHTCPGYNGAAWGYPFPWANRDFFAPAGTPSSVVTAFVGHALLDSAERLGLESGVLLARSAGEFLRRDLNRISGPGGSFCFSYTPVDRRVVHNANLLAASLLARLSQTTGEADLAEDAVRAARFSAAAQRRDGSWPYGMRGRDSWTDSFHTSYSLVALQQVRRALDSTEFDDAIERGAVFWRRAFFRGPAVSFYAHSDYPIDMHAVAHAIICLIALETVIPNARPDAERLAEWSLREMRDSRGFFYYEKRRFYRNRLAYMRWIQAWVLRALTELVAAHTSTVEPQQRLSPAPALEVKR